MFRYMLQQLIINVATIISTGFTMNVARNSVLVAVGIFYPRVEWHIHFLHINFSCYKFYGD